MYSPIGYRVIIWLLSADELECFLLLIDGQGEEINAWGKFAEVVLFALVVHFSAHYLCSRYRMDCEAAVLPFGTTMW